MYGFFPGPGSAGTENIDKGKDAGFYRMILFLSQGLKKEGIKRGEEGPLPMSGQWDNFRRAPSGVVRCSPFLGRRRRLFRRSRNSRPGRRFPFGTSVIRSSSGDRYGVRFVFPCQKKEVKKRRFLTYAMFPSFATARWLHAAGRVSSGRLNRAIRIAPPAPAAIARQPPL